MSIFLSPPNHCDCYVGLGEKGPVVHHGGHIHRDANEIIYLRSQVADLKAQLAERLETLNYSMDARVAAEERANLAEYEIKWLKGAKK